MAPTLIVLTPDGRAPDLEDVAAAFGDLIDDVDRDELVAGSA